MKKTLLVLIILLSLICLTGCENETLSGITRRPDSKAGSVWAEENGRLYFISDEQWGCTGVIVVDDQTIPVDIAMEHHIGSFTILLLSDTSWKTWSVVEVSKAPEDWSANFYADDEFTVKVDRTTYFTEDEEMTFHRITTPLSESLLDRGFATGYPGSVWQTDDETFTFIADEEGKAYGMLTLEDETLFVEIEYNSEAKCVNIYPLDLSNADSKVDLTEGPMESWTVTSFSEEEVTFAVNHTNYYSEGEEIVFYRTLRVQDAGN